MITSSKQYIGNTGRQIVEIFANMGFICRLFWATMKCYKSLAFRGRVILDQFFICGIQSLPVTLIVGVFTGMILALQSGLILKDYRLENYIGVVILLTMCKEAGPFMTAFILAGRVGSAMAAELGTMKVSEEIDALEVMCIDPVEYLVFPRMVALAICAPILIVYVNLLGVLGGAVVAKYQIGLEPVIYFKRILIYMSTYNLTIVFAGLFKGIVFGFIITSVSCAYGLRARNGAEGVGEAARQSVVYIFLLVLISNYFMSALIERIFGS
ncbi:MlaE family ABC transporter permease [Candidatus Uabimicrobium amorphum]|uniref:ABC transporter permease n=2 Tax=Uabimicrobium amorphum TaxID=2596890 RepID=A0A5S9IIZ4_UABAM|nr:ABC transporter permease [Candidatus Uabimicrobium amorphum]